MAQKPKKRSKKIAKTAILKIPPHNIKLLNLYTVVMHKMQMRKLCCALDSNGNGHFHSLEGLGRILQEILSARVEDKMISKLQTS